MPRERTPAVDGFRRETLVSFLRTVARRARDAGLSVTLCVMPPEIGGETTLPLATASTIKEIDVLGTDPYWVHAGLDADALVGSTAAALRHAIEGTETAAQIWIQGFRIPAGRENEIEIAVSAARRAGIENLAVWGFEACASMSHLRSDDPEKTWAAIVRAFSAP